MEWDKHSSLTLTLVSNFWRYQDLGRSELCTSHSSHSETVHPLPLWWGTFFEKFILSEKLTQKSLCLCLSWHVMILFFLLVVVPDASLPSLHCLPPLCCQLTFSPIRWDGYQWDTSGMSCCPELLQSCVTVRMHEKPVSKAPWCWVRLISG